MNWRLKWSTLFSNKNTLKVELNLKWNESLSRIKQENRSSVWIAMNWRLKWKSTFCQQNNKTYSESLTEPKAKQRSMKFWWNEWPSVENLNEDHISTTKNNSALKLLIPTIYATANSLQVHSLAIHLQVTSFTSFLNLWPEMWAWWHCQILN